MKANIKNSFIYHIRTVNLYELVVSANVAEGAAAIALEEDSVRLTMDKIPGVKIGSMANTGLMGDIHIDFCGKTVFAGSLLH